MTAFLLSVITVTKNCVGTINKTLDSVCSVKTQDMEYVVVDGLSTDGTLSALRDRGALVDCLKSEPDSGIYHAMNKAVSLSRGRYVLFINGDDELVSDGFPAVMEALARNRDHIICATTLVGDHLSPAEILAAKPWCLPFFNAVPHPSSFIRRELIAGSPFREDLRIASDYDFFLGAYLSGQSFRTLPVVTALHHRGGASGNAMLSQAECDKVRREKLGWLYPLTSGMVSLYRHGRALVRPRAARV